LRCGVASIGAVSGFGLGEDPRTNPIWGHDVWYNHGVLFIACSCISIAEQLNQLRGREQTTGTATTFNRRIKEKGDSSFIPFAIQLMTCVVV